MKKGKSQTPTPPKAIPLMKPLQPALDLLKEAKLAKYTKSLGGVKNYTTQRKLPVSSELPSTLENGIEIQLQRMAMASVPNRPPKQPLKSKSPFTEDMIEKFKRKEQQDIRSRGFIQGDTEEFQLQAIPDEAIEQEYLTIKDDLEESRRRLIVPFNRIQDDVKEINELISKNPELARDPDIMDRLRELALGEANVQAEVARIGSALDELKDDYSQDIAANKKARQANAQAIRNYEDMLRLLNQELPIQQMVGESDADYRERLISYRTETVDDADGTEARLYEHQRFKKLLAEIISLPLYQVELLIKELDDKGDERVYQLNEIWPKIKSSFEKVYGLNPKLRDPVRSLYDFMIGVLSNPVDSPEAYAQVVEGREIAQAVEAGTIDPSLEKLTKKEVLALLKDAGLSRGRVAEFTNKRVSDLKKIYTEYLRKL